MNQTPAFQRQQRRFLHYLRRPQASALPEGLAPERAAVYVGLLYNKFDESLSTCFPIIRRLLTQKDWQALLLDFIAEHRCLTPLLPADSGRVRAVFATGTPSPRCDHRGEASQIHSIKIESRSHGRF